MTDAATSSTTPPRDFAGLKALITERAPSLPKRLTQIAAFALENPDEIAFGTVSSIATLAEVQPSTLVRFAQAMGYQGFSEMQEVFRSRLRDRILNYDERLQQLREHAAATSKPNVIFHGFCDATEKSIASLRERLDPAQLDRAVELLANAQTIYLLGLRRSFPIASYMAYALPKLGVKAILVDAVGGLLRNRSASPRRRMRSSPSRLHPMRRRRWISPMRRPGAAFRWSRSPTVPSRRSPGWRGSGSRWRRPISRGSAPWRQR